MMLWSRRSAGPPFCYSDKAARPTVRQRELVGINASSAARVRPPFVARHAFDVS